MSLPTQSHPTISHDLHPQQVVDPIYPTLCGYLSLTYGDALLDGGAIAHSSIVPCSDSEGVRLTSPLHCLVDQKVSGCSLVLLQCKSTTWTHETLKWMRVPEVHVHLCAIEFLTTVADGSVTASEV